MPESFRPDAPSAAAPETAPRKRRPPRRVEVSRVQILSPAMRRITLTGAELQGFEVTDPASYMKLIFPEPGQTEPDRPLPDGPRAKSMRTYTPLAVRPDVCEVDVDFVLHGDGPASSWAAQAQVGQVLFLMGPGPGYKLQADTPAYLLIGDDSALPAFETILASLSDTATVQVIMEVTVRPRNAPCPTHRTARCSGWCAAWTTPRLGRRWKTPCANPRRLPQTPAFTWPAKLAPCAASASC